jgi:aspartyl-tRNA(Asn)/glutamyl-tRNA(Gln) amidotransferase subunit A
MMHIAEAAPLLQTKEISPVELVSAVLRRIARLNPQLNAFITITANIAEEQARTAEREILAGTYRGPLHGIPFALKDLFYTRGIKTTAGSTILADFVTEYDAAVVERLRAAGAVLVGKTNMHEFAFGADNLNPHYGAAINPIDHDRITGGSSGGSGSAVAAGLCTFALGSDTGGSIRVPAACCGIIGLKPTFGMASCYGTVPLSWSQDTVGPMTRSVADAAIVMNVLAGFDQRDPASVRSSTIDFTSELG